MAMLLARRLASSTPRFARLASNGSSFAEPQASVAGAEVRIPPGAIPQIHIEARGKHTAGLIKHVSSFLYVKRGRCRCCYYYCVWLPLVLLPSCCCAYVPARHSY